jgi:hypothetical protein
MSEQYTTPPRTTTAPRTREYYDVDATVVNTPVDRVRWASILAGLVTVLSSMAFFTVLGLALGLEAYDPEATARGFAIGASIYSVVSALISFAFGGYVAARTAAVGGHDNGFLQGAMTWMVTIALLVNFLGTGINTLIGSAANVASSAIGAAAEVAAPIAGQAAEEVAEGDAAVPPAAVEQGEQVATQAANTVEQAQEQLENVTPQQVDETTSDIANVAWWTLLALGLTAAAAIFGGIAGTRRVEYARTDIPAST